MVKGLQLDSYETRPHIRQKKAFIHGLNIWFR